MNKVVEFLNANPVQYLATVGRDGKAKCRPASSPTSLATRPTNSDRRGGKRVIK